MTLARRDDVSAGHLSVRTQLTALLPCTSFFEEVSVEVSKGKTLFFDFFVPIFSVFIEVQGEQHYKFNGFFHANKAAFHRQRFNDGLKTKFCQANNFRLVSVLPSDTISLELLSG